MNAGELQSYFAQRMAGAPRAARWIVGFSGGTDSLALLELCRTLPGHPPLLAAHLNHGIRGAEAERDEDFCRDYCLRHDVPFCSRRVDVPALARARRENLEDAARRARYDFFRSLADASGEGGAADTAAGQGAAAAADCEKLRPLLLLAHHRDDQIETILMRLLRGCGWRGLCGIPAAGGGRLFRPLLGVARADLDEFMARSGLRPCEDSSNTDISYTRNRLRHGVLPVLRGMFADLELRLLGAAGLAELVEEYTRRETEKLECRRQDGGIRIQKRDPAGDVAECGWRRAVEEAAALLAEPEQGRLRKAQAAALTGLLAGGGAQMLCGGLQLRREGEGLFLRGRSGAGPEKMPLLLAAGPEELRGDLLFEDAFCRLTVRLVRLGGDIPDRDNPWVEYIDPQRTSSPATASTSSSSNPSLSRIRWPGAASLVSPLYVQEKRAAVPTIPEVVMQVSCPAISSVALFSISPQRIFGPQRSCNSATSRPHSALASRIASAAARCDSGVPCEKFRRKTSTPA